MRGALPDAEGKFTAETAVLQVARRHGLPMPVRILGESGYGDLAYESDISGLRLGSLYIFICRYVL